MEIQGFWVITTKDLRVLIHDKRKRRKKMTVDNATINTQLTLRSQAVCKHPFSMMDDVLGLIPADLNEIEGVLNEQFDLHLKEGELARYCRFQTERPKAKEEEKEEQTVFENTAPKPLAERPFEHGLSFVAGLSRVFHCNHYNSALQTAVLMSERVGDCLPRELLFNASVPLVKHMMENENFDRKMMVEEFARAGFGRLRRMMKGEWSTPSSHYGQSARMHTKKEPSCYFTAGYIAGMTGQRMKEVHCQQLGASVDWFKPIGDLTSASSNYFRFDVVKIKPPERFGFSGGDDYDTYVDEDGLKEVVSYLKLEGSNNDSDNGLIDAFGVVLTNHFADYYNRITYKTYFGMLEAGWPKEETRDLFVQAGHICAFYTFGGIMSSPEWYQLVQPVCQGDEDWVHGMVAMINTLGWGMWRVERIVPDHELVIRIYNSYEGVGYRRLYKSCDQLQISFLALGAVQGLAHLLWKIDIKQRPELNAEFYANVFNDEENCFSVKQTHSIAVGHQYDRIIAKRK